MEDVRGAIRMRLYPIDQEHRLASVEETREMECAR